TTAYESEASLEFRRVLFRSLSADARFDIRRNDEDTDIEETILQGSKDPLIQRSNSSEDEENFLFNIDYKRPLGENGKLEAGVRTETKWRDSGYDASTLINDTWIEEAEYDQKFLYMENVNAADRKSTRL